jgi:hypothetical protein
MTPIEESAQAVAMHLHVLLVAVRHDQSRAADEACEALAKVLANFGKAIADADKLAC